MCELGEALHVAGDLPGAESTLSDAAEQAEAASLRALQLRAQLALLNLQAFGTRTASADDLLNAALTAIPTLSTTGDDRALGRAWYYASTVHTAYHCRHADAARAARQAIFHYQTSGWPTAACLLVLAASVYYGPTPVPEAVLRLHRSAHRRRRQHSGERARASGRTARDAGGFRSCPSEMLEARSLFTEIGQGARAEIVCGPIEADIELLAGDETRAQELLEANCSVLKRFGSHAFLATATAVLADVLYRRGRVADADELARDAQAHSSPDDVPTQWIAQTVQAKVLARSGQFAEAERLAASPGSPRHYGRPEPESSLPAELRRGAGFGRQIGQGRCSHRESRRPVPVEGEGCGAARAERCWRLRSDETLSHKTKSPRRALRLRCMSAAGLAGPPPPAPPGMLGSYVMAATSFPEAAHGRPPTAPQGAAHQPLMEALDAGAS